MKRREGKEGIRIIYPLRGEKGKGFSPFLLPHPQSREHLLRATGEQGKGEGAERVKKGRERREQ